MFALLGVERVAYGYSIPIIHNRQARETRACLLAINLTKLNFTQLGGKFASNVDAELQ